MANQGEIGNKKRNRRGLRKNKMRKVHVIGNNMNVIGINVAGITSKMQAFDKVLFDIHPAVFMLQETKRKLYAPRMKANNLVNYQQPIVILQMAIGC